MSLRERKKQRINRDVRQQAHYVVSQVHEQIEAGHEPPYGAYAYIRGLSPEETVREVGQMALSRLGEKFMLDAEIAERESSLVRAGAIIRIIQLDDTLV